MEQSLSQSEKFNEFVFGQVMGVLSCDLMGFMKGGSLSLKEKDIVSRIRRELRDLEHNLGISTENVEGPDLDRAVSSALETGIKEGLWYKHSIGGEESYMMGLKGMAQTRELMNEYGYNGIAIFNAI